MATIKDVAKKAGVGIATVSRVINDSGYVGKETKLKVQKVIEDIGYVPNEIARSMKNQKTDIVAFILPNSTHLFFGELLYNVEKELFKHGYKVMLCNSSARLEKEIVYLDMLKNNKVDAVILLTNNDIEDYLQKSLPLISFDRKFDGVPFVASDNFKGGELAAKRLISHGCKRLMFIGDDAQGDNTPVETEVTKRRLGFNDYIKKNQGLDTINVEYPLGDYIVSPDEIHKLIEDYPEIDGVFAISDAVAMAVIKELAKRGKKVPEDVKVIGFDGGRSFLNMGIKITSISQDPVLIAKAISELIKSYLTGGIIENKIIPVHLEDGDTA
ncbi:HTH-type transcriptional regulator DegA [Candidatus Izimaplasma bacterium HR1]|jgi:DNA-binding LacI/PurR family transcriptional regulator|uniref:LacI family DNA-binding transcriptional regulator n=1 Tax=Candidatus Izimoplasma sp. HR1 TaxID=1541959 RepID=UPI0004F645CF|nr:HTH-type transcriptional regulator DegA [Candidatus Izimaplasma bacterium HR1]